MRRVLSLALVAMASCGGSDAAGEARPNVVVTTNVLGDVVANVIGGLADVEVIMPPGTDPHDFAPSARQAEAMANADLLVVNGAGFEHGMEGLIAQSDAPAFAFADHVDLIDGDPHLWTDPARVAGAVEALGDELSQVEGIDAGAVAAQADSYAAELRSLDAEMESTLAVVPAERRKLVTTHEVFGYFADRFEFEVLGAIVPSTTSAQASAAHLDELAWAIRDEGIPAIFAETTSSTDLADALAAEAGGVAVVELFAESLGDEGSGAETYVDMMRTNSHRIAGALR